MIVDMIVDKSVEDFASRALRIVRDAYGNANKSDDEELELVFDILAEIRLGVSSDEEIKSKHEEIAFQESIWRIHS